LVAFVEVQAGRIDASRSGEISDCQIRFARLNHVYLRHTDLACGANAMPEEDWIKTLADGRKVKFIYQELPEDGAFLTAQIAGNEVVYSIVLTKAGNPLSRGDIERRFQGELSKR
jgi:hypothetical protein